jgi:hypothetical protein
MFLDDSTSQAIERLFPLLPWALEEMQVNIAPGLFGDLEPGTRAAVAHDLVMKEGQRRFTNPDDIVVADSQGLFHFVLPSVLLRVKRGDSRSLGIATNQTKQTMVWTYQLPLSGMPDPRDYLHMVYVPDPFWTTIRRCIVGVYHGKLPRASYEVDVDDWYSNRGATIDPFAREAKTPSLTLKPGVIPLPLEEIDGTS